MTHPAPSQAQVRAAREVTGWYLGTYYLTSDDVGVGAMFCDQSKLGSFAVRSSDLAGGEPAALYRVLTAVVMFQRRQDRQIARILQGISPSDASELTDAARLVALAEASGCDLAVDLEALKTACDLAKDNGVGVCAARPGIACAPKRHTVLLKRYGHFGKVPTALALAIRDAGASDLADLYARVTSTHDREAASVEMERALTRAWRVSDKIAAMYLSILCNDQLSAVGAPWRRLDPARFVVVDSNVDLFLAAIGYGGAKTYAARRAFIQSLARCVDLSELRPGLRPFDPRLVQQAMFMFMSASNRRIRRDDCAASERDGCSRCSSLAAVCPMTRSRGTPPR